MVDMNKLMQQAQQMQDKMLRDLEGIRVSATAGGGVVTATVNGNKQLLELEIDPAVVDPEDIEMLQDLVVAAVNEASRRADEAAKEALSGLAGMGGPGLAGLLG